MRGQIALLAAFAEAVAARQTDEFEGVVKAAYGAGAVREDLLTALEIGRLVGEPPEPVLAEAYATVHAWQWMAMRPPTRSGGPEPHSDRRNTWLPCTTR